MIWRKARLAVTLAVAVVLLPHVTRGQIPSRILVIPFENPTHDAPIFWLGEAASVLLTEDLDELGVPVITRDERQEAFAKLQVPPNAALSDATIIRIGQLVGASDVVVGSLRRDAGTLKVDARLIALDSGRIARTAEDSGPVEGLFDSFDRLARQLSLKTPGAPIDRRDPALPAFENYIKGLLAESPTTAVGYLSAAVAAWPAFDRARLALWTPLTELGQYEQALAAVEPVTSDPRLSRRARFVGGLSYLSLDRFDEAYAAFKGLADVQPTAAALNNAGIALLRRGQAQAVSAAYYFHRATEADGSDADYCFNLGYAYLLSRDPAGATYWLRETVRRSPTDGDAHFVLGVALSATGDAAAGQREVELARKLSSAFERREARRGSDEVPKGLERIKDGVELPHERRLDAVLASGEQRDREELARFYVERGRRLFQEQKDREALADLSRALYMSPYDAEAHLLVGRIHLRNARPAEAIGALKVSLWSAETVEGHVLLAEAYLENRELEAARAEAERAVALAPTSADAKRVLQRATEP
jgi:tetratricopeptide (TPR) repeat protein